MLYVSVKIFVLELYLQMISNFLCVAYVAKRFFPRSYDISELFDSSGGWSEEKTKIF